MRPRDLSMGLRGSIGGPRGSQQGFPGGQEGIKGIRIGLMILFIIHKAYMPV